MINAAELGDWRTAEVESHGRAKGASQGCAKAAAKPLKLKHLTVEFPVKWGAIHLNAPTDTPPPLWADQPNFDI